MQTNNIKLPSNKKFGYLFTFVFGAASFYCYQTGLIALTFTFCLISAAFLITSLKSPDILLPLNKAWMGLGLILGKFVSPLVLGLMFFGLITPIAIVMKIFKRDELKVKITEMNTYWSSRDDKIKPDRFKHQF